jgi:hypothetical protein
MPYKNHESQIALALRAMQNDPKLSARAAGEIDFVDHQKLIQPRRNILANSRKLTDLEELCLFSISLIWMLKDFRPECLLWKVWQIDSSRSVISHTSERAGPLTLLIAAQRSERVSSKGTTITGLNAKIQRSFVADLSLCATQLRNMHPMNRAS